LLGKADSNEERSLEEGRCFGWRGSMDEMAERYPPWYANLFKRIFLALEEDYVLDALALG
jgi:hypothetical protein